MTKAKDIIQQKEHEKRKKEDHIRDIADWFHDNEGELEHKGEVVKQIVDDEELDINSPDSLDDRAFIRSLIHDLVSDHVDPVQQIPTADGDYVGVIQYEEHGGYYTYTEYHDIEEEYTRAVCGLCIDSSSRSTEPYTRHAGEFGNSPLGDKDKLHQILLDHIEEEHTGHEANVETGATLASGTTIAGNTAIHLGNESFLDESGDTASGTITLNGSPSIIVSDDIESSDSTIIWDQTNSYVPQGVLQNDSITINAGDNLTGGGEVTLGGNITLNGQAGYDDADAINAINTDPDHGSTASHNYFSGSYDDLSSRSHANEDHTSNFTTLTEVNNNADVPNADFADNAGDADTVDGQDASSLQNWTDIGSTSGTGSITIDTSNVSFDQYRVIGTANTTADRYSVRVNGLSNGYITFDLRGEIDSAEEWLSFLDVSDPPATAVGIITAGATAEFSVQSTVSHSSNEFTLAHGYNDSISGGIDEVKLHDTFLSGSDVDLTVQGRNF